MSNLSLARYAIGVCAAAALIAGCNGGGSPSSSGLAPGAPQQSAVGGGHHVGIDARKSAMTNRAHYVPQLHLSSGKSWVSPAARGTKYLMYASDQSFGTVDVYAYKSQAGNLVGQATGFVEPYGQCLDSAGNIYVADMGNNTITEFAHGATTPTATVTVNYPSAAFGCSINPTNGDLAVAEFDPGAIVIFSGGIGGTQTAYTNAAQFAMWPPGYDNNGNLFVEGLGSAGYNLSECGAPCTGTFTNLSGITIGFAAAAQWDGHFMTATDQDCNLADTTCITEFTASGSTATPVASWTYSDNCYGGNNDEVQPAINGTIKNNPAQAGGNLWCANAAINRIGIWTYLTSGTPKRNIPGPPVPAVPFGQVVSAMKVGH